MSMQKFNFTEQDVDHNHGSSPGLAVKLKDCLKYLPELGIEGVAQGDLLFTDDKQSKKLMELTVLYFNLTP